MATESPTPRRAGIDRVEAANAALQQALRQETPACDGDDRFTASRSSPLRGEEKKDLYLTCFDCPIFEQCSAYATAAKPAAGYWAGKNYGTWERK